MSELPNPAVPLQAGLPPATLRRLGSLRRPNITTAVWLLVAFILVALVVNPVARLLVTSFEDPDGVGYTFGNYVAAYSHPRYLQALVNTLMMGVAVSLLTLALALPLAWAVSRTDMPGKKLVRLLVLGAFVTPPYLGAIGWILLAGPNAGWLNRIAVALTGAQNGPLNIYSFTGLTFVIAIYSYPYLFIFVSNALDLVSSEMEDAASIIGAGTARTMLRVTLPLVLPAILGGLIITFLESIALFGSPALIALPARFGVVTTQLWQFFSSPARIEVAAAYSMPLLLVTVALFLFQQRLVRRRGFVTQSGKGGERRIIQLGPWRWVMFAYAAFILSLSVVLPYLALAQAGFAKAWGRGITLDNFTFENFRYLIFDHAMARGAVLNSFTFAAATAFIAVGLALLIALIVVRRLVPFSRILSLLAMIPFVIPGIVLAIGFYAAYAPPPLSLYNTAWIMILAFTTRFLPIAYANSESAMRSLNPEMEDAVRILGGSWFTALRRVILPLLKGGLVTSWLLVFIPATRELSTAIFLYGPDTRTMSVLLFDMSEEGRFELLAAFGLILLFATIVMVAIGFRLVGRDFMTRRGADA